MLLVNTAGSPKGSLISRAEYTSAGFQNRVSGIMPNYLCSAELSSVSHWFHGICITYACDAYSPPLCYPLKMQPGVRESAQKSVQRRLFSLEESRPGFHNPQSIFHPVVEFVLRGAMKKTAGRLLIRVADAFEGPEVA